MKNIYLTLLFIFSCSTIPEDINGCTDPNACNYNTNANEDDGTCSIVADNCGICDNDPTNDCIQDCAGVWGGSTLNADCEKCISNSFDCMGNCCIDGLVFDIQNETQTDGACFFLDNCNTCDTDLTNDCIQDCAGIWGGNHIEDENGFTTIMLNNQNYERYCDDLFALQGIAIANNFSVEQGAQNENPFHSWDLDQNRQVDSWELGGYDQLGWWENGRMIKFKAIIPIIITEDIGFLSEITELILETNQLTSLPDNIGNLKKLRILIITSNSLTSIPESISNLTSLEELSISNNYISSLPIRIGDLQNLTKIDARNNQLSTIPESIGSLIALENLLLDNNKIITMPSSFGNIKSLEELSISNNKLSYFPQGFGSLASLKVLLASNNKLKLINDSFSDLGKLSTLRLNNNLIEDLPSSIENMKSIKELWLQDNRITYLPSDLGTLDTLETLFINNNSLLSVPESIGEMQSLRYFNINNNALDQLPESFCNIYSDLDIFSFGNNFMCDSLLIPSCLGGYLDQQVCAGCLPNEFLIEGYCADTSDYNILQSFLDLNPYSQSLPGNAGLPQNASDVVNGEWWENGRLVEITFQHKKITSEIPENFGLLDELRILRLTGNELIGSIPSSLMNLNNMLTLKLSSNKLSGLLPANISSLSNLDTLELDNNYFSGSLPSNIFNFEKMTYLDLNNNEFSGTIPDNISNLTSIKYLYMNHNQFSGIIPEGIGNLLQLKILKLHVNQFEGQLPSSICNIYTINENARISLDNNFLCPPYPDCISVDQLGYKMGGYPWNDTYINQDCD